MPILSVGVILKRLPVLFLSLPLLVLNAAAQDVGTPTLTEGALRVIRGCAVYQGVEGMKLRQGDMLETAASERHTQPEFSGGVVVALGPDSKLLLISPGGSSSPSW